MEIKRSEYFSILQTIYDEFIFTETTKSYTNSMYYRLLLTFPNVTKISILLLKLNHKIVMGNEYEDHCWWYNKHSNLTIKNIFFIFNAGLNLDMLCCLIAYF